MIMKYNKCVRVLLRVVWATLLAQRQNEGSVWAHKYATQSSNMRSAKKEQEKEKEKNREKEKKIRWGVRSENSIKWVAEEEEKRTEERGKLQNE